MEASDTPGETQSGASVNKIIYGVDGLSAGSSSGVLSPNAWNVTGHSEDTRKILGNASPINLGQKKTNLTRPIYLTH